MSLLRDQVGERTNIMCQLLHGSFSSILSSPGQQALELQLERFFTVFAWKWDPDGENFGTHLGMCH